MLYQNNIPTLQVVSSSGFSPKKRTFEFICTESNRDRYLCEIVLRKIDNQYKLKLTHYAGILDYPALQVVWIFPKGQEDFAVRVTGIIERELERIEEEHNRSMMHPTNLTPIIREAVRPIAQNNRIKKNSVQLNESDKISGIADWEKSIYGNRYPEYHEESPEIQKINNNPPEQATKRTIYKGRNQKTTKYI